VRAGLREIIHPSKIMKRLATLLLSLSLILGSASAAEKSSSSKIRGTGQAQDGGLFGGIQKDTEYVARTNAIIDAVNRAMEGQSDPVRKLFKDNWGKTTGPDRHGADDFINEKIVTESPGSGVQDIDKKTRTVTYVFAGTLDLTRLLEVLGGGEKSKLVPMVFYSMRETSQEQERVMGEATSVDVKKLEEIEGQVAASDNGTLKTEANQLKEKILKTREKISVANSYKFSISDIGPRQVFGNQLQAKLQDLGFDEFIDGGLHELSKDYNAVMANGEEPDSKLLKGMTSAAIDEEADYVAIMSITFQFPRKSGLTGNYECIATALGKVYKKPEGTKLPKVVAVLDPVILKGRGASEQEAKGDVAKNIAIETGQDMTSKLRSNKKL
jgi:hypothetical protein